MKYAIWGMVLLSAFAVGCGGGTSLEVVCGNGVLDPGEDCDDGNAINTDGCSARCRDAFCGDGLLFFTVEQCDDGNNVTGDGCSAVCRLEPPPAPDADADADADGDADTDADADSADEAEAGSEADADDGGPCVPWPELCNGLDDDCDGATDEGAICPCPSHAYGGHTYLFCSSQSWYEARRLCLDYGFDLASIGDAEENTWVGTTAFLHEPMPVWIGFSDEGHEGTWIWINGEPVTFTNWCGGCPNNVGGTENCTETNAFGEMGIWNDLYCTEGRPFVCESGGPASECPDGRCGDDETCETCPGDCGECPGTCGDGALDPGEECDGAMVEVCGTACGTTGRRNCTRTCTFGPCETPVEACNGVDDDCDGIVDSGTDALVLDATGDYVRFADSDALDVGTSDFTVEAWVQTTRGEWARIFSKGSWLSTQGYMLRTHDGGSVMAEFSSPDGDTQQCWGTTIVEDGRWHHVAASFDRDATVSVYVDGELDARCDITYWNGRSLANDNPPTVGAYDVDPTGEPFRGMIDEVRVWTVARTQEQIRGTACEPLSGAEPGLAGYWPFEGNARDASGHGNDGRLNGGAAVVRVR